MNAIEELEVLQAAIELVIPRMDKLEIAVNGEIPVRVKERTDGLKRRQQSEIQVLQNDLNRVKKLLNQLVIGNESLQRILKTEN